MRLIGTSDDLPDELPDGRLDGRHLAQVVRYVVGFETFRKQFREAGGVQTIFGEATDFAKGGAGLWICDRGHGSVSCNDIA